MNDIITQLNKMNISKKSYVYFEEIILERIKELKQCFTEWDILYSIKSNPNINIINCCYQNGLGFDVATINELDLILNNHENALIQYSCPGKTIDNLKKAMLSDCILVIDSIGEFEKINKLLSTLKPICRFGIRLNVGDRNERIVESMVGEESHFGIQLSELDEIISSGSDLLPLSHVHVYSGSQILDVDAIYDDFSTIAHVILKIIKKYNFVVKSVSFGGGFGVPYTATENKVDLMRLKKLIDSDLYINKLKEYNVRMCVESGRYIVAESGYFIANVCDVKYRYGKQIVVLDGLMNSFFRPIFLNTFHNLYAMKKGTAHLSKVVGNTCTPLDTLPYLVYLPKVKAGDQIVFENAGAYGYTMTPLSFIAGEEVEEIYVKK